MAKGGKWVSRYSKYWLFTLAAGIVAFLLLYWIMVQTVRVAKAAPSCDVRVSAPADLQARLNQAGPGKTVCLSGTFHASVRMLANQTLTGGHIIGTVDMHAGHDTVDGVEVSGGVERGIICGPWAVIKNNYVHDNPMNGIGCFANNVEWHIQILNNRILHNGSNRWEFIGASGIKLLALGKPTSCLGCGATVSGNVASNNDGNGIWFDQSSNGVIANNNTTNGNSHFGLRCEKCGGPVSWSNNNAANNHMADFSLRNSAFVTMDHNDGFTYIAFATVDKKTYPNLGDPHLGYHPYRIAVRNHHGKITGCTIRNVTC
jgi:parallel beta-helix repeat protein